VNISYQTTWTRPRDYATPFVNFGQEGIHRIRLARYLYTHCKGNPATTQELTWYEPRSPHTIAYEEHVLRELVHSTVSDVSIKEDLGYEAVMGIIQRHIQTEVDWSEIERLDVIGINEISLKKGHKDFVTIVTAYTESNIIILAVLKGREKSTVKAFLSSIPKRLMKTILVVCSDLYEGYINAAKEVFGKGIPIVLDRFHIAKLYRKGLDELRKREMKRLRKELPKEEYKKLKGAKGNIARGYKRIDRRGFRSFEMVIWVLSNIGIGIQTL